MEDGRRHEAEPEPKLVEWTPDRHPTQAPKQNAPGMSRGR
jgi:hypothetical protein